MDIEQVYEYIEEADRRDVMDLLDAVVNRFRELYAEEELILMTLPVGSSPVRAERLRQIIALLDEGGAVEPAEGR